MLPEMIPDSRARTRIRNAARRMGLGRFALKSIIEPVQRLQRLGLPNRNCVLDVNGFRFEVVAPRHNRIGEALYRDGVWEAPVTAAVRETIRPGMNVLDVGADIGYYTLLFASLAAPGMVFAFEPITVARSILTRNLERNAIANVTISEYALGTETRSAWLRDPLDVSRLDLNGTTHGPRDIEARIRRFDDLAPELGIDRVDAVKIDVEGAEHGVILGLERTLIRDRPVCFIEVHGTMLPLFGSSKRDFIGCMKAHGYRWRWLDGESPEADGTSTLLFEHSAGATRGS